MRSLLMRLVYRLATIYWWFTRPMIVGVRVMLIQDGQVILVKHTYQDHWYLPGGAVKKGEMPSEAGRREVMEEVGLKNIRQVKASQQGSGRLWTLDCLDVDWGLDLPLPHRSAP